MKYLFARILVVLLLVALFGCGKSDLYFLGAEPGTDIDVDSDTDSDTDNDSDIDSDIDTDGQCDGTPIVSQEEMTGAMASGHPEGALAQSFIPWADQVTDLALWLFDEEADVGPLTIELRADAGGVPNAEALASDQVNVDKIEMPSAYCASFEPVTVVPNETYWIVLRMAEDAEYNDYNEGPGWSGSIDNTYLDGKAYSYNYIDQSWDGVGVGWDFAFRVYGGTP